MKFKILKPTTWMLCRKCGTARQVYDIQTGIQSYFCLNCDDWQDHEVHYYEGDIIEVTG